MIMITQRKITIIRYHRPPKEDINLELQWFCNSLGLFGLRDKDKSCFRLFIALLKALKNRNELTSDNIATRVGLSRGTVIHHINKLIDAGLVVQRRNKYVLKVENLEGLVDEVEKDISTTLATLRELARDIDNRLGL